MTKQAYDFDSQNPTKTPRTIILTGHPTILFDNAVNVGSSMGDCLANPAIPVTGYIHWIVGS